MFKFTPTLQPQLRGAEDRVGAPAGTEGSAGPCAGGFPLACLGNWGLIVRFLHAVLTGRTLKALPFPSEEGGWKMRTWKVLFISFIFKYKNVVF